MHLAPDVAEAARAVDADGLAAVVAKHAGHLCVLLPVLLEDEFALVVVRLVLTLFPVLASLTLVLRHLGSGGGGGRQGETLGMRDRGGESRLCGLQFVGLLIGGCGGEFIAGKRREEGFELLDLGLGAGSVSG